MLRRFVIVSISLTIISIFGTAAQTVEYRSALLKELAEMSTSVQREFGKMDIITEYDEMGRVSNIGLDIFDLEAAEMFPDEICSFISRYFLELLCWDKTSIQQKLADDDVIFMTGSPEDALKITPDMAFSLDRIEDMRYVATWNDGVKTVLSFSFPIQYELILGMPQIEIEQKVKEDLISADGRVPELNSTPETEMLTNGLFRSIPASHYYVKSLTDCIYFIENEDGDLQPYFGPEHPIESAANLFHIDTDHDFRISMRQSLYGFKVSEFEISLKQWLAYCRRKGLKSYFAIEKEDESSLLALVICESKDLAYNHLLSVVIPKTFTSDSKTVFKAKLNAFIPTHNISELYQDEMTRAYEDQ